jgi:glycosyltransferase involved in cell wall biosynthesis
MKFSSITNVMNEEDILSGCLSLLDVDFKIVVISDTTHSGLSYVPDNSEQIAIDSGAMVIRVKNVDEIGMRNLGLGMSLALGADYAFIVDADEYYPRKTLENYKKFIEQNPYLSYRAKMLVSFRQPNWVVPCPTDHGSIVAIRTDQRFNQLRSHGDSISIPDELGTIYHISYARSAKKIEEKMKSFSHASEVLPNWFNEVFLPATLESHNVHPTSPSVWPDIKVIELPEEVKEKIPKNLWQK